MTKHHTKMATAFLAQGQQGPTNADWPGPPLGLFAKDAA